MLVRSIFPYWGIQCNRAPLPPLTTSIPSRRGSTSRIIAPELHTPHVFIVVSSFQLLSMEFPLYRFIRYPLRSTDLLSSCSVRPIWNLYLRTIYLHDVCCPSSFRRT